MATEANKAIVRRLVDEVFNGGHLEVIDELYAPALARAAKRLSAVLLVGLAANAALRRWWADPVAGLGIAALATVEGVRTWWAEPLADSRCDEPQPPSSTRLG